MKYAVPALVLLVTALCTQRVQALLPGLGLSPSCDKHGRLKFLKNLIKINGVTS